MSADFMEYNSNIIGQPANVYRLVVNDLGGVELGVFHDPNNNNRFLNLYAGNRLSFIEFYKSEQYVSQWYLDPNTSLGWGAIQIIEAESTPYYQRNTYSGIPGVAETEMRKGIAGSIRLSTGEVIALEYDSDGFIIKETFQDGMFNEFTLDQYKNPTRMRDRLGNVTLNTFNGTGNLITRKVGWKSTAGGDVVTPDEATYQYVYSGCRLLTEFDPLYTTGSSPMHRTDYEYFGNGQLYKVIGPSDTPGGPRAVTTYMYNGFGLVDFTTNPEGHIVTLVRDNLGRIKKTIFSDGTTEVTKFGPATGVTANNVVFTKDRQGIVTTNVYDAYGRVTQRIANSHTADVNGDIVVVLTCLTSISNSGSLRGQQDEATERGQQDEATEALVRAWAESQISEKPLFESGEINWQVALLSLISDNSNPAKMDYPQKEALLKLHLSVRTEYDNRKVTLDDWYREMQVRGSTPAENAKFNRDFSRAEAESSLTFAERLPDILSSRQLKVVYRRGVEAALGSGGGDGAFRRLATILEFESPEQKEQLFATLTKIELDRQKAILKASEEAFEDIANDLSETTKSKLIRRLGLDLFDSQKD
jgi:YD repeat-containing protein